MLGITEDKGRRVLTEQIALAEKKTLVWKNAADIIMAAGCPFSKFNAAKENLMSKINLPEGAVDHSDALGHEENEAAEARQAFERDEAEKSYGDEPNKSGGRKHGRSFIYLGLEDAEKAARKIDEHARRMTKKSFAQALGHEDAIGRFKQKLAALDSYGLVKAEGNDVRLTELAVDMLYGGNEQARMRARAKAFLSYEPFKTLYVECPKNQDHSMDYVVDFVRVTLKIVNEFDTFLKRFLESASYAGLLDGDPNPKAQSILLRPNLAAPTNGDASPNATAGATEAEWVVVDDVDSLLGDLGLNGFKDRCDVSQRSAGKFACSIADDKITVEVTRPVRLAIKTSDMAADIQEILKSLKSKGFKT